MSPLSVTEAPISWFSSTFIPTCHPPCRRSFTGVRCAAQQLVGCGIEVRNIRGRAQRSGASSYWRRTRPQCK
jgi:hypothetical protein